MRVFLVRHGETDHNARGIFQGYGPIPLSAHGQRQAELVAERLRALRPHKLYSSDIRRAEETATIIGQRLGLPLHFSAGLREWNVGIWAGQPTAAYTQHLRSLGEHPATYVPEGGESYEQTQTRMVAHMHALARQHAGETILCVSHGKSIDLFARHILGLSVRQEPPYRIANTSVNIFYWFDNTWEVVTLNEVRHLEGLEAAHGA